MKVMERLAKETYDGKLKQGELDPGYILETYKELSNAAQKGYGKNWLKVDNSTGKIPTEVLQMQRNLYKFSGAKNYAVLEDINLLLQKNKSWNDFQNEVLQLNPKYNKNYLQAEWQTAKQSALHASNWEYYLDNTKLYPNLKYKTQGDDRVRDSHKLLEGIVAPINSDFWKVHYIPNGWRDRCYVVQTAEEPTNPTDYPKLSEKEFPLEFRNNVAISGEIFKENNENNGKPHPYFALAKTADSDTQKAFELSKLAAPLNLNYSSKNGAKVKVSPFADLNDYEENLRNAKIISDKTAYDVDIRPHLDAAVVKVKNPEYLIDGKIADLKIPISLNYSNTLRKANLQGCEIVVYNIDVNKDVIKNIRTKLRNILKNKGTHPNIKEIIIIKGNNAFKFNRDEI